MRNKKLSPYGRCPEGTKIGKRGFTLVELLVVIAVIGMLASIVLVALGPARARARDARRQSDIRQISLAMDLCYDDSTCGSTDQYQAITVDATGHLTTTSIAGTTTTYMNPLPLNPGGGAATSCVTATDEMAKDDYCGYASSAGSEYCVYARLSNGEYFAASEKGSQNVGATRPASLSACP